MILIASVTVNPVTVNVGQPFMIQILCLELGDFVLYSGTLNSGQDFAF